jgi:hypothetical protein
MTGSARSATWPLYKRLLQRSSAPILCGPWHGEIGFESLYWVPFLKKLGIPRERLIPITRGGAHLWYPADRHVEIFTLREPKDLRIQAILRHQQTGMLKQQGWTAFDRAIVQDAAKALGLTRYHVLHPSWMYRTLEAFWEQRRGLTWLADRVDISPFPALEADGLKLPERFVAARFYARATFMLSEATQTVATETIKQVAQHQPVILLNSPVHADEHVDFALPAIPNVYKASDLIKMTPENNLMAQSAILSKAQGFVGTYGGLAQLALMFGKPTVSLYADWKGTAIAHKHYADAIATQFGVTCSVLRFTDIPLLHAVLPRIQIAAGPSSNATS